MTQAGVHMARDSFRNPPQQASRENTPVSFEEQAEKVALTHRVQQLESELHTMKEQSVLMFSRTEAEEEGIINRLMKRLGDLKKEKETLLIEVEREEELLTNTLQKRLTAALREKAGLESQLVKVKSEKEALALEVEREEELLTNTLQKKLDQLRKEKDDLEARVMVLQGCASPQQAARQQHCSSEMRENMENLLRGDAEGNNALVQKLKDALSTIKARRSTSTPSLQQTEADLLLQISQRVDRLLQLGGKSATPTKQRSQPASPAL